MPEGDYGWTGIFLKAWPAAFLWGIGTAMGEIPPYATSYAAAVAGEADEDMEEVAELQRMKAEGKDAPKKDPFTEMKIWMVDVMDRHGFWGVLLMSAWPNAMFDLCGICCGSMKMPFWDFFRCSGSHASPRAPACLT